MKKLFLLDAYALIFRAYYALIKMPRITQAGFNTSAIFGFVNTLEELLRKEDPSHVAVCFDPPGPTFRNEAYEGYKAERSETPEDIKLSIPFIKEIIKAYSIPVVEVAGYEADDVIGTLSRMAEEEGFTTYMMTLDKDYGQLVTDRVKMYRPPLKGEGAEIRGPREVCERYGIERPQQVVDLLALEGDASDNVPGCPGVGEKTASKLIAEWGSVENLIEHKDELKGALQRKVSENADQILFSKMLVTIKTDVPLGDITPETLVRRDLDTDALIKLYKELEFRTFLTRLTAATQPAQPSAPAPGAMGSLFDFAEGGDADGTTAVQVFDNFENITTFPHLYAIADSDALVAEAVAQASQASAAGIALNASGDDAMTSRLLGVAVAPEAGKAFYVPLDVARPGRLALLSPLFSGKTVLCSGDIKRDILLLKNAGIELEAPYFDTAVAHYLVDPEAKHTLPMLARTYLSYDMLPAPAKHYTPTAEDISQRFCEEADVALRLQPKLDAGIEAMDMRSLLENVELPLTRVLAEMEWTGVRVDVKELTELSRSYTARLAEMESRVYEMAGCTFNIGSPMQVGDILFGQMKIDPAAKRTKRGFYSTTEDILEKYRAEYPIVDLILRIRALRKLVATYINALPELINPRTGKIHTSYNQTVTATGRLSSTNPNLQNIPVRSDDGREIRKAFIADPGDIFLSADYSQIELRLMADMSGDPDMVDAFLSGADIHRATAAKIYHEAIEDVTDNQRRNAKTANFGIIYGISAFGLSERLGIPRAESKALIEGYFRSYPKVKDYISGSIETARDKGYVATVMGRRRMLPDINSRSATVRGYAERNAVNAPLQGSAADIIKVAMVRIYRELTGRNMRSRMIMQVHDELIFNVVPSELEAVKELVRRQMEGAYSGRVPLEVSMDTGDNWLQAH